jgi:PAS domain S-box-containing protein
LHRMRERCLIEQIVPQSAGSLAVAVLALMMTSVQFLFAFRQPRLTRYLWGAAVSFSGMLYAVGIFLEYNMPAGSVNHFGGVLEFTAHVFLIHSLYGMSFVHLGMKGKRYHMLAGIFHILLLALLWFTPLIVSDQFVGRDFIGLAKPFVEAGLGPLGPLFIFYIAGAAMAAVVMWLRHEGRDTRYKAAYLAGMIFWLVLGIHDGLAALGLPTFLYVMEYGFFGFSIAVLWVVFDSYADISGENRYRVITEFANDGILVIQDDRTVFENPACTILFGRPMIDLSSNDFLNDIVEEDRESLMSYYKGLLQASEVRDSLSIRIKRSDGEEKILEIRANLIRYRNRPALLIVMRDVTERVREEAALKEQEEKLTRLKKMESLGLLAGGVAHDLNNVLSGIVSYPELLLLHLPEGSELKKPLETIKESGQRASAIVQDLLTVARGVAVPKEPFDLNTVIRSYLNSPEHKKLLQHHPLVTVKANLDSQLLNIKGSPAHIRKVIMNLVSNASEAIEERGAVLISTTNRYVDQPIKGYENVSIGKYVVLVVENSGPAISADDLKRIFEPFYTKKVMGRSGTGLGLTVVWNVMQDHEGYIDVISNEHGAKFELYFPVSREAVILRKSFESLSLANLKGDGEMILVIDDVKSQREISCMMLEALGYKAAAMESGEAAVAYLKEHRVDLLLLDMIMDPGINGRETYERIKKIHSQQKAVIVSGFAETAQVKETMRLGAGRYLKKPLILEELGRAIKETLAR